MLFEIVNRVEAGLLSWDRPLKKGEGVDRLRGTLPVYALSNRPSTGCVGNGRPAIRHNARRIDWFLGSLFENRGDVVEADLSVAKYRCLQQSCSDSI